jgi:acetyl esterase/lipase
MPSIRSHLYIFVLRNWHRTAFTSAEGLHRWIAYARQRHRDHRPPLRIAQRVSITSRNVDGFPVYEVRPKRATSRLRLLYLHGGAFLFEIGSFHWDLIAELAERTGAEITVPVYPLAPEHDFHAIFGMTMKVYRELLGALPASDIVFAGDSAGGNMAVVMTMMAAEENLPAPAAHVLISPGLDVSLTNPDVHVYAKLDPWLAIPGGLEAIRLYADGFERTDWHISPIFGDLSVLPRTLLLTGTRDILHPDSVLFAEKARQAGVEVELVVEPGMIHVWPLLFMPEARRARSRIVAFLKEIEGGERAPRAIGGSTASSMESVEPEFVTVRGSWPFAAALASIISRFGVFG